MRDALDASTPDEVLVRVFGRDRSEEAFSLLYDRHTEHAYRTVWRLFAGNETDAEDAMQEAWVRAIESLHQWRGGSSSGPSFAALSFGAWLRGIAVHVSIDMLRRSGRFTEAADDATSEAEPILDRLDLESAMSALAPGYRAVLVLHDIEGYTHEEIAAQLGITAGTSKGQLFKARRAMRARLTTNTERGK
jgi:RNA polymerase sigma factor (sigma-70 family)